MDELPTLLTCGLCGRKHREMRCPPMSDERLADMTRWLADPKNRGYFTSADVAECVTEIHRLRADCHEAREWVRKMVRETQELRCAFCGEAYPPGTSGSNDEALAAHIRVCAKHPMRAVESERHEGYTKLARLLAAVDKTLSARASGNIGNLFESLDNLAETVRLLEQAMVSGINNGATGTC